MPRVSIIVPVRNEAAHLRRALEGLLAQDFPQNEYEVLVIDGASEDGTADIVRDLQRSAPNLFLFHNPKRLSSSARNIGVRQSRGELLVIVDGHCDIGTSQYVRNLVDAFDQSGADTLGRPQPLRAGEGTPFQQAVAVARESWLGHNPASAIFSNQPQMVEPDNVAVAYRRHVFDRIGYFDEAFDACEDVEFNCRARRAGMTCFFTPTIGVAYRPRSTWRSLAYQLSRYGRGRARLGIKSPTTVTIPSLMPPMWFAWVVSGGALALLSPTMAIIYVVSLLAYAAGVVGESVRIGIKPMGLSCFRLPRVFLAIHVGFAVGYWKELFGHWNTWVIGHIWRPVLDGARSMVLSSPRAAIRSPRS